MLRAHNAVIASQRVRPLAGPMTRLSEAIQELQGKSWIASSQELLAMTLMVRSTPPRSRDTMRPSFANSFRPHKEGGVRSQEGRSATLKRGRGEDRVRAAPAVSRAKTHIAKSAHEHTGSAEAVRPSLRNGFTAYFVLSPARPGLFVTVIPKNKLEEACFLGIDTSHWGVRTTRLRRPHHAPFVKGASASTAPRPNVSDDGLDRSVGRDDALRRSKRTRTGPDIEQVPGPDRRLTAPDLAGGNVVPHRSP